MTTLKFSDFEDMLDKMKSDTQIPSPAPLTLEGMFRMPGLFGGLRMISSVHCIDLLPGTHEEKVRRTWKERFSWPFNFWNPWKIIHVCNWKPAMYIAGDMLIYHPSLECQLRQQINGMQNSV